MCLGMFEYIQLQVLSRSQATAFPNSGTRWGAKRPQRKELEFWDGIGYGLLGRHSKPLLANITNFI